MIKKEIISAIKDKNMNDEKRILSRFACPSSDGLRRYPDNSDQPDFRPLYSRDTDKIIHSRSYTRYIDKTQVFFLFDNDNITHRVLHVQLVSKIARVIGRALGLNEDLIEAIALGHDIGHVPYGHTGERILDYISRERKLGFFHHNAQSVRFLMEVENWGRGLNLCLQVLDGILTHNGEILDAVYEPIPGKSWDNFLDDYKKCWLLEDFDKKIRPMTLEGCVVRVSDIVAYIGRDIEDAVHLQLIAREDIPDDIRTVLGNTNSQIVNKLVSDILNNSFGKNYIAFSSSVYESLKKLLDFNYQNIYLNPVKTEQDELIKEMFEILFEKYLAEINAGKEDSSIVKWMDSMDSKYIESNKTERLIIDYIAGMTDEYFNNEFQERVMPRRYGLKLD